jgi:hypothetical protein
MIVEHRTYTLHLGKLQEFMRVYLPEPLWQDYMARAMPLFQLQESKILLPTAFSPMQ